MAVAMDIGNIYSPYSSAHPTDKKDVGERLAKSSLAVAYGKRVYYTGPLVSKIKLLRRTHVNELKVFYHPRSVLKRIEVRSHKEYPAVGFEVRV